MVKTGMVKGALSSFKVNSIAYKLMLVLPVTTLFQAYPGFNSINQFVAFVLMGAFLWSFFLTKYHPINWLTLLMVLFSVLYSISKTNEFIGGLNDFVYLPFWYLIMMVFSSNSKQLKRIITNSFRFAKTIVVIWSLIVGISIFIPSSYGLGWGGGVYFGSLPGDIFRLAPTACLIMVLLTQCVVFDKKSKLLYLLSSLIPLYIAFMGGSRTYFVVLFVLYIIFLKYYINNVDTLKMIVFFLIVFSVVILGATGLGSKIAATRYTDTSYLDLWGTISNGRTVFWQADLNAFMESDFITRLFGGGYDWVYLVNIVAAHSYIWAHNDFINILMSNGYIGLLIYLFSGVAVLLQYCKQSDSREKSKLLIMVTFIWLFNACFNMAYTYTCFAIAFAIFPTVLLSVEDQLQGKTG
ncbi:O-antigen ligase [Paraeggerthella sp. Marseille-Q4926]|uniref:O-antigen ligase family protein n=1 Tax=Paraeggerthella sp. Marseille-Q4926 TaxID=2866587 RepID=UPI001CE47878|nr:O-antigen ligase family protein [Paraeggerthella sp. Marseille-Q4926]